MQTQRKWNDRAGATRFGVLIAWMGLVVSGCGGTSPLNTFADPATLPSLAAPILQASLASVTAYSVATEGFVFTANQIGQIVRSPAGGTVAAVSAQADGGFTVWIYHNARASTRMSDLTSTSMAPGRVLAQGEEIGRADLTRPFKMTVYLDGQLICPYSFLNTEARTLLNAYIIATRPCVD
jgi:hypothetical protein